MKVRKHGAYVYMKEELSEILTTPELHVFYTPSCVLLTSTDIDLTTVKESLKTLEAVLEEKIKITQ